MTVRASWGCGLREYRLFEVGWSSFFPNGGFLDDSFLFVHEQEFHQPIDFAFKACSVLLFLDKFQLPVELCLEFCYFLSMFFVRFFQGCVDCLLDDGGVSDALVLECL